MKRTSSSSVLQAREDRRAGWLRQIDDIAGWVFYASLLVALGSLGYLIYVIYGLSGPAGSYTTSDLKRLHDNILFMGQVFLISTLVLVACVSWLFYEQEVLGYLLLIVGVFMYGGVPYLVEMLIGAPRSGAQLKQLSGLALQQVQLSLWIFVVPGGLFIAADIIMRISRRLRFGAKADQLQYGVGITEERDVKQRFMGKCWQLPYCRKFVRQRCPIFHARRTCWKERVGCMCEENVIQNAMKGVQTFSKDSLANAKYIPYNNTLPMWVKRERCRNCVIYNEHQRHKYRLFAPIVVGGMIAGVVFFHDELVKQMLSLLTGLDNFMMRLSLAPSSATRQHEGIAQALQSTTWAAELILICLFMIALAYSLRLVEFLIFKLKV